MVISTSEDTGGRAMSINRLIKDFAGLSMLAWAGYGILLIT